MSRTNKENERIPNPAELFLKWSSDNKAFVYWDKTGNDGEGEEIAIPANTPFIVLDMLNTATGYDEKLEAALFANEVRNCKTQAFQLYAGKKMVAHGVWEDIKGHSGVKFAKSVYAMAKIDGEYRLIRFRMSGSACGAWFDFVKDIGGESKLYGDLVVAQTGSIEAKKGKITFNAPVFEVVARSLSAEAKERSEQMDSEELQPYLKNYFESNGAKETEEEVETDTDEEENDTVPF